MRRISTNLPALLTLTLSSWALGACSSPSNGSQPGTDDAGSDSAVPEETVVRADFARSPVVTADEPTAVAANNAFALDLYNQAAPAAKGGNFLTSPFSASLALTMTYAGAQGSTASEMAKVLHVPAGGSPTIFAAQNSLSQAINAIGNSAFAAAKQTFAQNQSAEGGGQGGGSVGTAPVATDYEVQVVNSIWGEKGYTWESPFLTIMAKDYGTGVYVEDFAKDPAAGESAINRWVSTETAGKISPLLPPDTLDNSTRMVLVNAIHLKLPWDSAFDPTATAPAKFTRGDGTTVEAPTMHQVYEEGLAYNETAAGQFVAVPLAGDQLSVVFALPKKSLAALTATLTKDSFSFSDQAAVTLSVPKFSFTSSTFSLADSLQALGMTQAFDPSKADFKGLCANPPDHRNLYISDVLQKATLDVAENGVEAAAATAVLVSGASVSMEGPSKMVTLNLDQPFLVSIVDASGAVLFLGQIDDPTDTGN